MRAPHRDAKRADSSSYLASRAQAAPDGGPLWQTPCCAETRVPDRTEHVLYRFVSTVEALYICITVRQATHCRASTALLQRSTALSLQLYSLYTLQRSTAPLCIAAVGADSASGFGSGGSLDPKPK
eukprot:1561781-Prymnesium_polylepis.1